MAWVAAVWLIEWNRLRSLITYAFLASFLCGLQDQLGLMHHLWEYRDSGPINTHTEISILIGLSAAPLFAMYFTQGLKAGSGFPAWRILSITAVAMVPETIALATGHIIYAGWWNYGCSVLAHALLWSGFAAFHTWLNANQGSKSD